MSQSDLNAVTKIHPATREMLPDDPLASHDQMIGIAVREAHDPVAFFEQGFGVIESFTCIPQHFQGIFVSEFVQEPSAQGMLSIAKHPTQRHAGDVRFPASIRGHKISQSLMNIEVKLRFTKQMRPPEGPHSA